MSKHTHSLLAGGARHYMCVRIPSMSKVIFSPREECGFLESSPMMKEDQRLLKIVTVP